MAEAQPPSPAQATSPAPAAAPSEGTTSQPTPLEKVYNDFKIEDQAATFQPQPAAQPAPTPAPIPKIPDAFDPNFGNYQQELVRSLSNLNSEFQQTRSQLTAMQRQAQQQKVESDIRSAVGIISEKASIEPEVAEVALEVKARNDPKFRAIWEQREKNPKAFQAALGAFAMEAQQKFTVRQDPQLVENQRAMQVSRNQMATTTRTNEQSEWDSMTPADRQAKVQLLLRQGGR